MGIFDQVGSTDLTRPQLSIGWVVGAVVGVLLLIAAYMLARKVTDVGTSAMTKVQASAPIEALMG